MITNGTRNCYSIFLLQEAVKLRRDQYPRLDWQRSQKRQLKMGGRIRIFECASMIATSLIQRRDGITRPGTELRLSHTVAYAVLGENVRGVPCVIAEFLA